MTRQECEAEIIRLLRQIIDVYHVYNPDGNYLSLTYLNENDDQFIGCFNQHWENGADIAKPIDCHDKKEKEE